MSDLDGDGIGDLVCTCAVTLPTEVVDGKEHERTNLLLVSGASGGVIGGPYLVDLCTDLASLNVTESLSLRFGCKAGNGSMGHVVPTVHLITYVVLLYRPGVPYLGLFRKLGVVAFMT